MPDPEVLAPVDYLAVEFPSGQMTGAGFRLLRDVVERGIVAVLDLEFLVKDADGVVARVALEDVPQREPMDVSQWEGTYSGILDEDDLAAVGAQIRPGSLAGVLVYENVWAAPIMQEIMDSGASLLGSGRIDGDDLVAALGITAVAGVERT